MIIQVDYIALREKANEITLIKEQLLQTMDEIESLVLSTNGNWQGDSGRAFSEKIIYVKKFFEHIYDFLDSYSNFLKDFSDSYEQKEKEISLKINQI